MAGLSVLAEKASVVGALKGLGFGDPSLYSGDLTARVVRSKNGRPNQDSRLPVFLNLSLAGQGAQTTRPFSSPDKAMALRGITLNRFLVLPV